MVNPPPSSQDPPTLARPPVGRSGQDQGEKRSLAAILRDFGPMRVSDAVDVVLDVCEELANAHLNGVVHGDLGVHRVRTSWPRRPGDPVDIYALAETDTAAFEVRASGGGFLVAPEQRDGRIVDARADIFAVGVILHWLIAGRPPGLAPVHRMREGVPRPGGAVVEACLADDPARRPQSVDEIAQALGSFALSPPARFAQVARRRSALLQGRHTPDVYESNDRTLGRLDEAAFSRELSSVAPPPPSSHQQETLVLSVHSVFSEPPRPIEPEVRRMSQPPPDPRYAQHAQHAYYSDSRNAQYMDPRFADARWQDFSQDSGWRDSAWHNARHAQTYAEGYGETYAGETYAEAPARARVPSMPPVAYDSPSTAPPPPRSPWTSVLGFIATAAVVAFAVLIGARLSTRGSVSTAHAPAPEVSAPAAPALSAPAPVVSGRPTTVASTTSTGRKSAEPPTVTPSALPDARPTKRSAPGRRGGTKASAPRGSASGETVPTTREVAPAAAADEVSPGSVLNDALRQ
jgi:hypothetical protein